MFGYNPWIIFCHFFRHFSEWIEGTLCAQLLLQFNTDTFETLQTLRPYFEDMYVVGIYSSDQFLSLFLQFELSHFFGHFYILKVTYQLGA